MDRPYFLETSLPFKVREYLKENRNKKIDLEALTEHLIANNKEFRMKKKKLFMKSVSRAYHWEISKIENSNNSNTELNICCSDDETPEIYEIPVPQKKNGQGFSIDKMYTPSPKHIPPNRDAKNSNVNGISDSKEVVSKTKRKMDVVEILDPLKRKKKKNQFEFLSCGVSLRDMEGLEPLLEDLIDLSISLRQGQPDESTYTPKSVLINGPEGCGKSMLIEGLAGDCKVKLMRVSFEKFLESSENLNFDEEPLEAAFREALSSSPCILHIDNLHLLIKSSERKIVSSLIAKIKDVNENHHKEPILIAGEIKFGYSQDVDVALWSAFDHEIFIPPLDKVARAHLLKKLCSEISHEDVEDIARRTPSYVAGDLVKLNKRARMLARRRRNGHLLNRSTVYEAIQNCLKHYDTNGEVQKADFDAAIKTLTPTLKREGFPFIPEVKMADIGGMEDVKAEIRRKILRPILNPELYEKCGFNLLTGILLYGPPGCGKTLLAKAIANEAALNFLPVNSGEMLKMYQGESERAIREAFKLAASVKPCIIFFDEFDCIAAKRCGEAESGSKQSIVNTLLMEMDGIINRNGVYIMASTNRPDVIDSGVLRPGRIDTKLFVGIPDVEGRVGVLKAATKNGTRPPLVPEIDLKEISARCHNFTGADCVHLINVALERALDRMDEMSSDQKNDYQFALTLQDFEYALENVNPSVSVTDLKYFEKLKNKYESSKVLKQTKDSGKALDRVDEGHQIDESISVTK